MIAEITPPPWEAHTPRTWLHLFQRLATYAVGLLIGTATVGLTAGLAGTTVTWLWPVMDHYRQWVAFIAAISVGYGLHEMGIIDLPAPQSRWQVPIDWSRYGKMRQLFLYGVVLGAEAFTYIPYASFYVLLLLEATLGIRDGATLGFAYGLARVVPTTVGVIACYRRRDNVKIPEWITRSAYLFHVPNSLLLMFVGEVLLWASLKY